MLCQFGFIKPRRARDWSGLRPPDLRRGHRLLARFTAPPNMVNSAVHTSAEAMSHLAIKNHGSWVWVSPVRAFFPKPLGRTDLTRLPLSSAAWRRNGCPIQRLLAAGHLMPGVNGSGLGCIDGTERAQQQSVRSGRFQIRVESPNEQVCGLCSQHPRAGEALELILSDSNGHVAIDSTEALR